MEYSPDPLPPLTHHHKGEGSLPEILFLMQGWAGRSWTHPLLDPHLWLFAVCSSLSASRLQRPNL